MTSDHGLFLALRQKLQETPQLKSIKIYLFPQPQQQYPRITLMLEQIKSCFADRPLGKKWFLFSGEIAVQAMQQHLLLLYGHLMIAAFDGVTLQLEAPYQAMVRFLENRFTPSDKQGICTLKHTFETLIH